MKYDLPMIVAYAACAVVWIRFLPYIHLNIFYKRMILQNKLPKVSVIIPARDEVENLPKLIDSLLQINYPDIQIIVADDRSEDHTAQLAEQYGLKVIRITYTPSGWTGKNWACHNAVAFAEGDLLLFTDADTIHTPDSLRKALYFMKRTGARFISAPSYHINKFWWEKLLGPFYCLLHAGASLYDKPDKSTAYALGQYLLMDKKLYFEIGGHAAIKQELAEDTAMARNAIQHESCYRMYKGSPLCKVQMYNSFKSFIDGWTRLIRMGFKMLRPSLIIYTLIPLLALNVNNLLGGSIYNFVPAILTLICFTIVQYKIGNFSILGVILFPLSIILFVSLATKALFLQLLLYPIKWRGRTYPDVNINKV